MVGACAAQLTMHDTILCHLAALERGAIRYGCASFFSIDLSTLSRQCTVLLTHSKWFCLHFCIVLLYVCIY